MNANRTIRAGSRSSCAQTFSVVLVALALVMVGVTVLRATGGSGQRLITGDAPTTPLEKPSTVRVTETAERACHPRLLAALPDEYFSSFSIGQDSLSTTTWRSSSFDSFSLAHPSEWMAHYKESDGVVFLRFFGPPYEVKTYPVMTLVVSPIPDDPSSERFDFLIFLLSGEPVTWHRTPGLEVIFLSGEKIYRFNGGLASSAYSDRTLAMVASTLQIDCDGRTEAMK